MNIDFAAVLVLLTFVSGAIWAYDALFLAPRRRARAKVEAQAPAEEGAQAVSAPQPSTVVDYARSFFPIFLIVLVLRSFVVEPFRIPSGSMMPTLLIGDFILVNKFTYGIRLPVIDTKIIDLGKPKRGDVVVFRYPEDPSIPFIKRVIGLPGDRVAYYNKMLYINGKPIKQDPEGTYVATGAGSSETGAQERLEHLDGVDHQILIKEGQPSVEGQSVIPAGQYFVMGDNRDNSRDSRYWGTVPDKNLIGKAFLIWMSWDCAKGCIQWGRIGESIH